MHRTVAAALVAALALGVASCGGGEESLTRAELARRIETACRQAQAISQRQARARRGSSADSGSTFIAAVLVGQRALTQRIGDLHPSDAVKDDFDVYRRGMQQRTAMLARVEGLSGDALARATRSMQSELEAVSRRVEAAARRLGVENCS